jgi:hypothetical protein
MNKQALTVLIALGLLGGLTACGSSNGDDEAPNQSGDGDGDGDGDTGDGDGDGDTGDGDGDGDTGDGDGDGDGDTSISTKDDTDPVSDDFDLYFDPMYSAYDGVHDFKIPAIVQGVQKVRWSANPANAVTMVQDSETGGIMITTKKPGTVKIIARAGQLSGSATLHITDATEEDWVLGNDRYNNMIPFPEFDIPDGGIIPDGGFGDGGFDGGGFDIPNDLSCRNCHGAGAEALDVEHTPQQTGGYSDEDLINIFTNGTKPPGAQFHTSFPEFIYTMFHTWDATDAEKKGIVVYLRSLEPKSQGDLDFGGLTDAFGGGN